MGALPASVLMPLHAPIRLSQLKTIIELPDRLTYYSVRAVAACVDARLFLFEKEGMATSSRISKRRKSALADGSPDYASKRDDLVRIAAQLFREHGYHATKLGDIAALAGIDRASLYYYIGSKEELLRESMAGILGGNLGKAQTIASDKSISISERLTFVFKMLMQSYDENYPQMFVYIQEQMGKVAREPTPWAKEIVKNTRKFELMVTSLIEEGIKNGEFAPNIPAKLASYALFGMFNWTHRWYMPGGAMTADEISDVFVSIFLNGIKKETPARSGGRLQRENISVANARSARLSTLVADIGHEPAATNVTPRGTL
jgi:TetR/AcrR family transcriptional regulator, cholesterol catabolism regulator